MVGINGLGGVQEPKSDRPSGIRDRKTTGLESGSNTSDPDGVVISSEAQAAATIAGLIQTAGLEPDIRAERVAEARQSIERGDFKNPEIVAAVADRISKFL